MPPANQSHWILVALYFGMIVPWGLNFLFVHLGLGYAPPLWLAALRAALGTAGVAVGLVAWSPGASLTSRERREALLLGVPTTGLFFALWFFAATQVPPGQTAVVIYTFPLWVAILSFSILRERPSPFTWPSIAVGFLGVVLLEQPWSNAYGHTPVVAVAELLGAAVCWATGTVFLKWRIRGPALRAANAYQLVGGAAVLFVAAVLFEPNPTIAWTASLAASVLWLGLIGTALGNVAWFALLERFPASTVSTWAFLTPVVAVTASIAIFGERLDAIQLIGVAAVLGSVFVVARIAALETRETKP
ncbi:MAG: DMT family transporter [Thermoplasmata archaeon]|nr:DMT family transporter [Thermoplasmata archaeon]